MAENKTAPTAADSTAFIEMVADPQQRADARVLVDLLAEISGEPPVMWGPSIVGFGQHHYRYASGREGDTFIVGFSPRKQSLTVYLPGYLDQHRPLLNSLGKHTQGKGCLYIKRLSDVDVNVLRELLQTAVKRHGANAPA